MVNSPGTEIPRVQSPVSGGLARDATPVQTAKRQLDATSQSDPKRARLTRTGAQRPGVEKAEQANKIVQTTRQHPNPKPPKRRDTSLPEPKVEGQEQVPPATRLRKRQIDSEGDDDEHELKRARLTRKNLARFNKMGRKKGSNNASTRPDSTDESTTTKSISTTSSSFPIRAHRNGILDPSRSQPPTNLEHIHEQHARSRATASPPELVYERYVDRVGGAGNEATVVHVVSGHMLKEYDDKGYQKAFNRAFTAFPKDVGFNNGLSAPQPDFAEGLEMQDYPFPVEEYVSGAVLYKDDPRSVTLPHLAGEWKGPDGSMAEAMQQSGYDGAALVYARNQALSLIGKPDPPGHAEVRTFTTDGTNINFYAHYAALSEDNDTLEYHQYQYASANVKDTHQGHKDGYKGIRNEQDHAKDQSYALRDQLKKHWKQRTHLDDIPDEPVPAQESSSYPDDDGEVEEPPSSARSTRYKRTRRKAPPARGTDDESGYEIIDRPSYAPTPPRSSEERRRSARLSKPHQLPGGSANIIAEKTQSSSRGKGETVADY
ncbi:hypothetical protein B0T24DRAFT_646389 [Lasiosphaeria ovina]|uniref:Uncharacterized protein n=1 Tax=Lasiosphaeria ovina TaxID=92902 RepID=A0AAE0NN09_9PEZI|nr:hypothetical protein B0T24DRAFT_646389 [Lasiosphaeria ovina]